MLAVVVAVLVVATACGGGAGTVGAGSENAAEFAVDQISPDPRDNGPSALDDPGNESFPDPLIDLDRIRDGGPPPDGIPAIDDPVFQDVGTVDWLEPNEAVLALEIGDDARAYPIQVMTWHEIVNDTVADTPVTVSYCPLCNSALAFDRRLGARVVDFGTSGRLFNSSMVMYDRQTESLWTHFDGHAVAGALTGEELETLPIATTSWDDFRAAHPDGLVLTRSTGHSRDYGRNPYAGYDDPTTSPFLYDGDLDPRLEPKARVVVVRDGDEPAVALVRSDLLDTGVFEFEAHGRRLVAVLDPGTASPLDRAAVAAGYDQGAVGVFDTRRGDSEVSLVRTAGGFRDETSDTTFDIFGDPVDGSGPPLEPIEHLDTFWFAIAAFDRDVVIVGE